MASFTILCFLCTVLVWVKPILSVSTLQEQVQVLKGINYIYGCFQGIPNFNEFRKEKHIINRYIQTTKLYPQILADINLKREPNHKFKIDDLSTVAVGMENKSPLRVYEKTSKSETKTLTYIIISYSPQRMSDEIVAELKNMKDDEFREHVVKSLSDKKVTKILDSLLSNDPLELAEKVFKEHSEFTQPPPNDSKCFQPIERVLDLLQKAYNLDTLRQVYYINFDEYSLTALEAGSSYVFAFVSTIGPSTSLLATYVVSELLAKGLCWVGLKKLKEQLNKDKDVMFVKKAVEVVERSTATKTQSKSFLAEYCHRYVELVSLLEVKYYNGIKLLKTEYYILYGVVSRSGLRNLKLERNFGKQNEGDYSKFKKENTEWMKIATPDTVPKELLLTLASAMVFGAEKKVEIIEAVALEKVVAVVSNGNKIYETMPTSGSSIQSTLTKHSSVEAAVVQLNTNILACWPFKNLSVPPQPKESIKSMESMEAMFG